MLQQPYQPLPTRQTSSPRLLVPDVARGMALLGIPSKPMETDWGAIILKALTIKGVYGREMFTTWRKMLGLLKAGLDLSPLITHRLGYADYREGFEAMRSGQSGKVVLDWDKAA